MTKKELLKEAQELGLEVTEENTKAEIQKALDEVVTPPKIENEPIPVTYDEHIKAGFVHTWESESLQSGRDGKKVLEIKNVEGETLHRLEK